MSASHRKSPRCYNSAMSRGRRKSFSARFRFVTFRFPQNRVVAARNDVDHTNNDNDDDGGSFYSSTPSQATINVDISPTRPCNNTEKKRGCETTHFDTATTNTDDDDAGEEKLAN